MPQLQINKLYNFQITYCFLVIHVPVGNAGRNPCPLF